MTPHRNAAIDTHDSVDGPYKATEFRCPLEERVSVSTQHRELTYIARLIIRIQECFRELGVNVDDDDGSVNSKIEGMSILIHESMSISSRNYHSVQHVFDISRNLTDPIAVLAALFHDCIYYHVDGGLTPLQRRKLQGAIVSTHTQQASSDPVFKPNSNCTTSLLSEQPLLRMVEQIFGYTKGQAITNREGLNEYLSAVIAVRELEPFLPMSVLAEIATCIELTIPFRGEDKETGESAADELYKNLSQVNESDHLGMSDEQVVTAVQRAVILSNEDVENFGTCVRAWSG
jgi:hypothetical protein